VTQLLVLEGDGIGPEICAATLAVLHAADRRFALGLTFTQATIGFAALRQHGTTCPDAAIEAAKAADGVILGPVSHNEYPPVAEGGLNPSGEMRRRLDLYANIRPARTYPGLPSKVGAFDLVVVRENTEGFYADRNMEEGNAELKVTQDVVISLRRVTRQACNRIAHVAFEMAGDRKQHITAVHKANVLRLGDGMFLAECRDVARGFPAVLFDDFIVDAMMAHVVRAPSRFDVIVTTNMFGDILTDLTAELSGSIGLGGSLNQGADYAMAQAAHGSAPDIAGKNIANPYSLILSAALLIAWYGRRSNQARFVEAAAGIDRAIEHAILAGEITRDIGGRLGTREAGEALAVRLTST